MKKLLILPAISLIAIGCSLFPRIPKIPSPSPVNPTIPDPPPTDDPLIYLAWYCIFGGGLCIIVAVGLGILLQGAFARRFPLSLVSFGLCSILLGYGFQELGAHKGLVGIAGVFIILVAAGYWFKKKYNLLGAKDDS